MRVGVRSKVRAGMRRRRFRASGLLEYIVVAERMEAPLRRKSARHASGM